MIYNLNELHAEKKRLQKERVALVSKLSRDWSSLKNLAESARTRQDEGEKNGASSTTVRELVKTGLRYGIGLFAREMANRTIGKIDRFL
jgi:hypothetical protein